MVITYHGLQCFKVQFGDTVLVFNPPSKDSKYQSVRFSSDVILSSIKHKDFTGVDTIPIRGDSIFIINGPGEYEVKGVFVKGLKSESEYDGEKRINTVYIVRLEKMSICFLGALSEKDLSQEILSSLDGIDILFVPIGGDGVLGPEEGYNLAVKLAPKVIVPMHYKDDKDVMLKTFLKEEGAEGLKPVDKLTVKAKDITDKEGEIVAISMS